MFQGAFTKAKRITHGASGQSGDPDPIKRIMRDVRGNVAYDIGANVGNVASILANNFAAVFAFEPAEESFEKLKELRSERIRAFNMAVSDTNGFIELEERTNQTKKGQLVTSGVSGFDWGKSTGKRLVPALTLDTLVNSLPVPDFVKIDTEGHEARIMKSGNEAIVNHNITFLIEIHTKENGDLISEQLRSTHVLEIIRHPGHSANSENWLNHYFVLATRK